MCFIQKYQIEVTKLVFRNEQCLVTAQVENTQFREKVAVFSKTIAYNAMTVEGGKQYYYIMLFRAIKNSNVFNDKFY